MNVTVELSLYPLGPEAIPAILAFVEDVSADAGIEVVVNQISTQLRGPLPAVMAVLGAAMERSFERGPTQALVAKFLSVDLPITETPNLGPRD